MLVEGGVLLFVWERVGVGWIELFEERKAAGALSDCKIGRARSGVQVR